MKTIIAGSRSVMDADLVSKAIKASGLTITEIVCGCAGGVDYAGYCFARLERIPVVFFPAWAVQMKWACQVSEMDEMVFRIPMPENKSSGIRRNMSMAEYADALVAIWDGKSRGTKHMIDAARKRGLVVYVHNTETGISDFFNPEKPIADVRAEFE